MRAFFLFLSLATCLASAQAQEQESKLADGLLRPDMSRANSAQDKKFTAVGDKKFVAKSFYSGDERTTKTFWGLKSFFSKGFATEKFSRAEAAANARADAEIAYASTEFPIRKSALVRSSAEDGCADARIRRHPALFGKGHAAKNSPPRG